MIDRLNAALVGRYRIKGEVGEGGMATVYLAQDERHNRKVALKVLKPELAAVVGAERFLAEIETTANLQHPHILPLYDSGEADSFLFYVMPYVEGESLRERLQRQGELPVAEALSIVSDVAEALDYAHRQGVIHRDVKPANILLQEGRPLVADFGIALAVTAAGGGRLTETGLSLGTPHYMSPEQATADRAPGPASDVYSLGCVLYEMLTGHPPFSGRSAQAVLAQIITGEPIRPTVHRKTIPPHVEGAILRAQEKLPADRFSSAAEFARALRNPAFRYGGAGRGAEGRAGLWNPVSVGATLVAAMALGLAAWGWLRPVPPAPVTRYRLALPEEQSPSVAAGVAVGRFEFSPDGRKLAFVGGAANLSEIWLLDRGSLEPTRLPTGTAPGTSYSPFFSPDGESVGFLTDAGDLGVVSLRGGAPRTLLTGRTELGGAHWAKDGHIYADLIATPENPNGIGRVPEGGGSLEMVTSPDTTAGEINHLWPYLLPGERVLVFTAVTREGTNIKVHDLETGESTQISSGLKPRYVEPGYLVWVAEGVLMAAPFEPGQKALESPPVALLDGVSAAGTFPSYAVSTEGTLIYATGSGAALAEPVWVERNGTVRPVHPGWEILQSALFQSVALSPDDSRLVVSVQAATLDLWVKQLDQGPLSRLTFEGPTNFRARWFPDGRRVLFSSDRGSGQALWSKAFDGSGGATPLLDGVVSNQGDVSPDGRWIAYREARNLKAFRPGEDHEPVELVATAFDELAPAISPDGRWVAYLSNETGRDEIYVRPFPDASAGRWQVSTEGGSEPHWSADGEELFYRSAGREMVSVEVLPGETFRTGTREVLFSTEGFWFNRFQRVYDVASDGRFVMLRRTRSSGDEEVVIVENFVEELKRVIPR